MDITGWLKNMALFFSPPHYKRICSMPWSKVAKLWWGFVGIAVVFFFLASVIIGGLHLSRGDIADHFTNFTITVHEDQTEPFYLIRNPDIYIDMESTNMTQGKIALLDDRVVLRTVALMPDKEIYYEDIRDISDPGIWRLLKIAGILMLPGLAIAWMLFNIVKYALLGIIFISLGYLFNLLLSQELSFDGACKSYVAVTVFMVVFDFFVFPFYQMFLVPVLIALIVYLTGVFFIGNRPLHSGSKKKLI